MHPNYRSYPYNCTVKQFDILVVDYRSCTFISFFTKAYVVGTHLNCHDESINSIEYQQHML